MFIILRIEASRHFKLPTYRRIGKLCDVLIYATIYRHRTFKNRKNKHAQYIPLPAGRTCGPSLGKLAGWIDDRNANMELSLPTHVVGEQYCVVAGSWTNDESFFSASAASYTH